jgi:Fic family protein
MVTIKRRVIGKQTYFYLEHNIRKNGRIEKREKYLGKKIPDDIEKIKSQFLSGIYQEKWYPVLDRIKEGFSREIKKMPEFAKEKETETFMIRFTYDTQRIEGSKLTLRETDALLKEGITPREKPIKDVKEAEAHKGIFYEMINYKKDLSMQAVLHWHAKLFENTKPEIAGRIRKHQVAISGSKFMPPFPAEVYPLLQEFFRWYDKSKKNLHPVELSALVHLKFVTIHPFSDGNGRTTRLMMNFVLKKNGFPLLNIPYEKRSSYYNALERSQVKREDGIFLNWFFRRYVKEQRRYLKSRT